MVLLRDAPQNFLLQVETQQGPQEEQTPEEPQMPEKWKELQ
jgi:hypothetical protein